MANDLIIRDQLTEALFGAIHKGEHGLAVVPGLIKKALQAQAWGERFVRVKKQNFPGFRTFEEYVETTPPEGLGSDLKWIEKLASLDPIAKDLFTKAMKKPPGGANNPHGIGGRAHKRKDEFVNVDNVHNDKLIERPSGNAAATAYRRLSKDAPDLHAEVLAGNLSPHAAMVKAGFRKRTITVPHDVEAAARILIRHFDPDALKRAMDAASETPEALEPARRRA